MDGKLHTLRVGLWCIISRLEMFKLVILKELEMLKLEMFRLEMLRLETSSWEMLRLEEWNGPPQPPYMLHGTEKPNLYYNHCFSS